MNENEMPRSLSTAKEAAKILGVCQDTLRKLAKEGKIYREPRSIGSPFYLYDAFTFLSASGGDTVVPKKKEIVVYLEEEITGKGDFSDEDNWAFLYKQLTFANAHFPDYKIMESNVKSFSSKNEVFSTLLDMVLTDKVSTIILFRPLADSNIAEFFIIKKFFSLLGAELINLDIRDEMSLVHNKDQSNTCDFSKFIFKSFTDSKKTLLNSIKPDFYMDGSCRDKYVSCSKAAQLLNISKMTVLRRGKKGALNTFKDPASGGIKYQIDNIEAPTEEAVEDAVAYYLLKNENDKTDYNSIFAFLITKRSYVIYTDTRWVSNFSSLFKIMKGAISKQIVRVCIIEDNLSKSRRFTSQLKVIFEKLGCVLISKKVIK
jgi:predicted site-specific integrase-resolvase